MPLQNRVDPFGEIHARPERGLMMGNRGGCFHRPDKTLKPTRWTSLNWIACLLEFKGRRRALMQPGLYTELFFLDEATALSAGHRPCYECRREDAKRFARALVEAGAYETTPSAPALSQAITTEIRDVLKGAAARKPVRPETLPDGALFAAGAQAFLKLGETARLWRFSGYGAPQPLPERALRLTPKPVCRALEAGYAPLLHPSASG